MHGLAPTRLTVHDDMKMWNRNCFAARPEIVSRRIHGKSPILVSVQIKICRPSNAAKTRLSKRFLESVYYRRLCSLIQANYIRLVNRVHDGDPPLLVERTEKEQYYRR